MPTAKDVSSTQSPIIIEFAGGLGNQLFQYTFAKYIESQIEAHPETQAKREIFFDCTAVHRDIKRDLLITEFNIKDSTHIHKKKHLFALLKCRINNSLSKIEKIIHRIYPYISPEQAKNFILIDDDILSKKFFATKNFTEKSINDYIDFIITEIRTHTNLPVYIRGYWQYSIFYQKNISLNLAPIQYKNTISQTKPKIFEFVSRISKTSSCSLHIRRGDYLESSIQSILPTLDNSYYINAITYILQKDAECIFYIFSDDPLWCKDELIPLLAIHFPTTQFSVVSGEYSHTAVEDLIVMNICTHHILANSSFSWWGATMPKILSEIQPKTTQITIAPSKWFTDSNKNKFIHMPSWVLL